MFLLLAGDHHQGRLKRPPLSSGDKLAVFGAPTLEVAEKKAEVGGVVIDGAHPKTARGQGQHILQNGT